LSRTPSAALLRAVRPTPDEAMIWLAALRAQAATRSIPIIVLGDDEDRSESAALGAAAFIVRPVSGNELASVLSMVSNAPLVHEGEEGERS
jgi:DNA-binding response OmpR family regulator